LRSVVAFDVSDGQDKWIRPGTLPAGSLLEYRITDGTGSAGYPPRHCGVAMEWSNPATRAVAAYSYDSGHNVADLPDVWRCLCGFQLDSWVNVATTAGLLADISQS
jgi:hypothetical protein